MTNPTNSEGNQNNNAPTTLFGLIWNIIRNSHTCPLFLLIILISVGSAYWFVSHNTFGTGDMLIRLLKEIRYSPPADPNFASFGDGHITTDKGNPFSSCRDSQYGGISQIYLGVTKEKYLHANFKLNRGIAHIEEAYVCFYADFSTPQKYFDVSQYKGIKFRSRLNITNGKSENMSLLVSISTSVDAQYYMPREYNFIGAGLIGKFDDIRVPFTNLKKPPWMHVGDLPPFNPKAIYRITFAIRGEDQKGELDIDDISFYK